MSPNSVAPSRTSWEQASELLRELRLDSALAHPVAMALDKAFREGYEARLLDERLRKIAETQR
jgi:hypothetical protein